MEPVKVRLNAPMLIPVAGIVAGTLIAMQGAEFLIGAVCIMLAVILYELLGGYSNSPTKAFRLNKWHYSWVAMLFVGAGIIAADMRRPAEIPDDRLQNTVMAHGHIAGIQHRTSGDWVTLNLTAIMDTAGRVYPLKNVRILGYADDVNAGIDDNIIFPCRLQRIVNSANSFDTGYAKRMARQGVLYSADMGSDSLRVTGHSATVSGFFHNLRERFVATIENTMLAKDTQRFLITVLAGDKSFLDPDRRELFADAGISHILALSGLHVSIIAGILLWLLFPFNIVGLYQWRYAIAVPAIWLYAFITGLSPSTVRAAGMMTVMITCMLIERKNSPWNSLLLPDIGVQPLLYLRHWPATQFPVRGITDILRTVSQHRGPSQPSVTVYGLGIPVGIIMRHHGIVGTICLLFRYLPVAVHTGQHLGVTLIAHLYSPGADISTVVRCRISVSFPRHHA